MSSPSVSVVIPTCDRPDFVVDAVESALAQSLPPLEVIVVDDASDTGLGPVLDRFGPRLRLDRLPQRSGANVARNRGVDLAKGEYVAFLDDDDIWMPGKTEVQIAAMARGGFEACLCRTVRAGERPDIHRDKREVDADWLRRSTPCGMSGLLVRREAMAATRFDPSLPRAQDWDLFVRLVQRGPLGIVPEPLYERRTGHARITSSTLKRDPDALLREAAAIRKHRAWLGDSAFRGRLARLLLAQLEERRGKARFLAAAIRHAGLRATLSELRAKLSR